MHLLKVEQTTNKLFIQARMYNNHSKTKCKILFQLLVVDKV
jgi:hypothetical protein